MLFFGKKQEANSAQLPAVNIPDEEKQIEKTIIVSVAESAGNEIPARDIADSGTSESLTTAAKSSILSHVTGFGSALTGGVSYVGKSVGNGVISGAQLAATTSYDLAMGTVSGVQEVSGAVLEASYNGLQASAETVRGLAKSSVTLSAEATGKIYETMLTSLVTTVEASRATFDFTLDKVSGVPGEKDHFSVAAIRLAVGLLPVIGECQAYGDARKLYREALLQSDEKLKEEMIHEARRDCLVLCTLVGFQLAALPATGVAQFGFNAAKNVVVVTDGLKSFSRFSAIKHMVFSSSEGFINSNADTALQYDIVRDTMQWLLEVEFKNNAEPPQTQNAV